MGNSQRLAGGGGRELICRECDSREVGQAHQVSQLAIHLQPSTGTIEPRRDRGINVPC
jgi:hypothetical protein